jgi:hypothetical protein
LNIFFLRALEATALTERGILFWFFDGSVPETLRET